MAIAVLADEVINKIAAGEVVERPASVVKELVENSIDAGSTRIEVEIRGGGLEFIRVTDNGHGILLEEMPAAFTRHATSKLRSEDDLINIATLGFRGEALPSIASVSKVEMISSVDGLKGGYYAICRGQEVAYRPAASPRGTQITVLDLFDNVPARKKFLKTPVTESGHVHEVVARLAMAHPDISFRLLREGRTVFLTPGNGVGRDTIRAIRGDTYADCLYELSAEGLDYMVSGLLSKPEHTRSSRNDISFFVNGRWVRSPLLARAVEEGYKGRLLAREYPFGFLYIKVPAPDIDVNVHPQKTEIRFRDEKAVFNAVASSIRQALDARLPGAHTVPLPGPEQRGRTYDVSRPPVARSAESRALYQHLFHGQEMEVVAAATVQPDADMAGGPWAGGRILGQVMNSYILVEMEDELVIIDQHAAAERLRYNEIAENEELWCIEELLVPVVIHVAGHRLLEIRGIMEELRELGFVLEEMGPETLVLRAAPALARGREEEMLLRLVDELATGEVGRSREEVYHQALASLACHSAVRAGQRLGMAEMESLVRQIMSAREGLNCPHGRPTLRRIPRQAVAEMFKR